LFEFIKTFLAQTAMAALIDKKASRIDPIEGRLALALPTS